jgi:8-oxo-dGTP pyrophosphatase MutT (NUDIX family)
MLKDPLPPIAFHSLVFRGPRIPPLKPQKPPQYKTAGGILRYETKFGDYRYALVKGRRHQKWSFPKGHVNQKENPYNCALREIAEETGLDLLPFPTTSLQIGFGYYYLFDVEGEYPLCPRDKEEIMDTTWVTIEDMQAMELNADVSQYVRFHVEKTPCT